MTRTGVLAFALTLFLAVPPLVAAQDDVQTAALIGLARVSRDAGNPAEAARYFQSARSRRAFTTEELTEYFWVLRTVDPARALSVAGEILRTRPMNDSVREGAIAVAIDCGDETTVLSLAQEGRLLNPGASRWLRRLGESYLRSGRAGEAADQFMLAAGARDGQGEDRLAAAVSLTAAGRYPEAIAAWNRVPATALTDRVDLSRLRLQALAQGAAPPLAAAELDAWLVSHPFDRLVRAWLVDVWERGADLRRAFTAAKVLASDGDVSWLRRSAELARAAGLHADALRTFGVLLNTSEATRDDRIAYVELALQLGDYAKATTALDRLLVQVRGCDDELFPLLDRLPAATGTDRLSTAVRRAGCADSAWGARVVARLVAEQRHAEALTSIAAMTAPAESLVRLRGLLLQWTGASRAALDALEPFLRLHPDDVEVRLAVVDAHRALAQPYLALEAARPVLAAHDLSPERRVDFARLALEADAPGQALALAEPLTEPAVADDVAEVRGRALLTLGRPEDAVRTLDAVAPQRLTGVAAATLLDALAATRGVPAARQRAGDLAARGAGWTEVVARQLVFAQVLGDAEAAAALRTALCATSRSDCIIADAQAQLALEQPLSALRRLDDLGPGPIAAQSLVDDLRALALDGIGEYAQALDIVGRLRTQAPARTVLLTRERILHWRMARDRATLASVVDLAERFPADRTVQLAVARTLSEAGQHQQAVQVLSGADAGGASIDRAVTLADALRATGDLQGALAALADVPLPTVRGAIMKAELQASVLGPAAAIATLREWARRADAPEALFLTWAALEQPGEERLALLREAVGHQPKSGRLTAMLAVEQWRSGDGIAARRTADLALGLDPASPTAWFVAVDATADAGTPAEFQALIGRLRVEVGTRPDLAVTVSDHVAGLVHDPSSLPARALLGLLGSLTDRQLPAVERHLAEARLAAAIQDWTIALTALERARRVAPHSSKVLRLRADVLGWSGQHALSVAAYDEYLRMAPDDLDARRQQARVAGWGGRFTEARRLYDALQQAYGSERAVAAEAEAKVAFYDGRWRDAVRAYRTWIELEPDNTEARFEQAEAMRSSGDAVSAERMLADLATRADHRLAAAALAQSRDARRPVVTYVDERRSAAGFEGARLLDLQRQGGRVAFTQGDAGQLTLFAAASQLRAAAAGRTLDGRQGSVGASVAFSPVVSLNGYAGDWAFGARHAPDARLTATWKATDRVAFSAGAAIEPIAENLATLDEGLTARGPFALFRWAPPSGSVDAGISRQRLSDGNARTRINLSSTRIVSERARALRLILWAEATQYAVPSPGYFSPDLFVRADAGLEYTHVLQRARYSGDRQRSVRAAYLEGTDNRGARYHHPALGATLPFGRRFTLNATADWIRSAAYNESSFTLDIRLNGLAAAR